ncbi:hypothetical protein TNCV_4009661 [Trichonephila clavipes]|nr:hypothetical protein TNCV_4009661 [Trichonephila clavipes]
MAIVGFYILLGGMTAIGRSMGSGRRGFGASSGWYSRTFDDGPYNFEPISDSSRLLAVGILIFPGVLIPSIQSVGIERCNPPTAAMYTGGHSSLCRCWICDKIGMCHPL